jgi:CDP-diacylglycerol---glycerol-3-phosphate 3-phosphatidyltransferase
MMEASHGVRGSRARSSLLLPRGAMDASLWALDLVARGLVALGVTANAITVSSVVLAAIGGVLLAFGEFGWAGAAMVAASLGDALDGMVARRSRSASMAGALLDASVDRYEEFFFLGGLAVHFHDSTPALVVMLAALVGSFMVSYGSAKAEAFGVPVPAGAMRRAERAVCLCGGVLAMPVFAWATRDYALPGWATDAPILFMVTVVAVGANVSAVRRLRLLAAGRPSVARSTAVVEVEPVSDVEPASDPEPTTHVAAPHAP